MIDHYQPKAAFIYSTCIVGVIGDDVEAVCRAVAAEKKIPVLPVHSEGFKGTKKDGYRAACDALGKLVGTGSTAGIGPDSINILGDFNLAGETWMIRRYYEEMGVEVVATITGDGRIDDIRRAHGARLNVVQCSGSMVHLAKTMEQKYGIPFRHVSYFGIEDMAKSLYDVAEFFGERKSSNALANWCGKKWPRSCPNCAATASDLEGRRAAVYTGGAFKAFSLVRSLRTLGMKTVMVGSQTGNKEDYRLLRDLCDEGTILVDDTNPARAFAFRAREASRPVHRRREGTAHRLQAGHRLLRPQPRAERSAGGFRGHDQLRPRGPSLGDLAGLETRAERGKCSRSLARSLRMCRQGSSGMSQRQKPSMPDPRCLLRLRRDNT